MNPYKHWADVQKTIQNVSESDTKRIVFRRKRYKTYRKVIQNVSFLIFE